MPSPAPDVDGSVLGMLSIVLMAGAAAFLARAAGLARFFAVRFFAVLRFAVARFADAARVLRVLRVFRFALLRVAFFDRLAVAFFLRAIIHLQFA